MGISGLLSAMQPATRPAHVRDYQGRTLVIDGATLLYKVIALNKGSSIHPPCTHTSTAPNPSLARSSARSHTTTITTNKNPTHHRPPT